MVAVPSMIPPQLMSMSSSWRCHSAVLVASLSDGVGTKPKAEPRPVVKQIRLAPPRHLAGDRHRVVARRVHEDEALGRDRLGVLADLD